MKLSKAVGLASSFHALVKDSSVTVSVISDESIIRRPAWDLDLWTMDLFGGCTECREINVGHRVGRKDNFDVAGNNIYTEEVN